MKKFFLFFCLIFSAILSFAQSPQGITFQAVARDPSGNAAKLRQITVIDRILSGSSNGTVVWEEKNELTTNAEGVFTIIIGKGTKISGSATSFGDIKWDEGLFFFNLKVSVAPSLPSPTWTADANFIDMGTSQFWSVPYALSSGSTSAIAGKEDVSNKSTSTTLGRSDVLYPSQNAVKTYVDATVSSGAPDADNIIKGKLKLAGDLGGTADLPRVPALVLKAPINNPTFTGTVNGITKAMVGLGYVDNTSDASKTISTLTQAALDLKAPLASPTFTGTPTLPTGTIAVTQPLGTNSLAVATTAFVAAAVTSGSVEDATTISLGKIQLAGDLAGTASLPTVPGLASKAPLESPTFTGTVSGITATMVGLGNVDNTSDLSKEISTLTQTALELKAPLASPTFTGTPTLPTGTIATTQSPGNNTTAVATTAYVDAALVVKAPIASPTFTGTPKAPTAASSTNNTEIATTAFVQTAISPLATSVDVASTYAPLASPIFTGTVNGVDAVFSGDVTATTVNGIATTPSDKRLKTDIKPLSIGIETIMKLNPVSYKKKISISSTDYSIKENGFIAQELQKILPIVVKEGTDENKLLSVNYISIIPVLTKAIQEQQKQIADQQKQINDLKVLVEKLINKK